MNKRRPCYLGETIKVTRNGYGVYQYENAFFRYEGEWQNNKKHGHGKLLMADDSFYEGEFCRGEITGHGTRYWALNGNTYTGQMVCGEMHGRGMMEYRNGSVYEGDWVRNMKHGHGTFIYPNGDTYVGEFYQQKQQGEGVMTYSNGDEYKGYWVMNNRQGHGVFSQSDGSVYEGQFNNDTFNGEGEMQHASGLHFRGIWVNGRPDIMANKIVLLSEAIEILQGQEFELSAKVVGESDDIIENENDRQLRISAGFRHHPAPEGSALFDMIEDLEEKPIETPYGYSIVPFPLTELSLGSLMRSHTNSDLHLNVVSDQDGFEQDEDAKVSAKPEGTTEPVPEKDVCGSSEPTSQRSPRSPASRAESPAPAPPTIGHTKAGEVCWRNLLLPRAPALYLPYCVLDEALESSGKSRSGSSKANTATLGDDEAPVTKQDVRRIGNAKCVRPGEYIIMVEDVTEPPFMGVTLDTVFAKVRVHAAPEKAASLSPKKDTKRRRSLDPNRMSATSQLIVPK